MPGTAAAHPFRELRTLLDRVQRLLEAHWPREVDAHERMALLSQLETWCAAAEQRKRRSDSVIDAALDAVVAIDSHGCIVEWNREAERMFGWKRREALRKELAELIIPARYRSAHQKGLQRFLETGTGPLLNRRTELAAIRRDRKEFPVELTVLEPFQLGGQLIVHAFVRDISERRQAEKSIRGSEALYHSLVDSLPISVIRKNVKGKLTFANRTYCELMERPLDELLGKTDHDLFPPELAAKYVRDDLHVVATGQIFHDIEKNVTEGRTHYFEVYKVPVFGARRRVVETQAIFWDVTERVETRDALARERDLLKTLINHLPDLVYVKDLDSRYVIGNEAQAEWLGLESPDDIPGLAADGFFPSDEARRFAEEDRGVMESGEPMLEREDTSTDRHGRTVWFSSTKVPLRDRDGSVLGVVGIDRNITKRRLAEDELRRSNRELDQFVSVVTHDLHAPLRGVSSYCRLLERSAAEKLDAEEREYLGEALGGLRRMQRLIDSLRSYARATEKKRPHQPTNLNDVVRQALSNLEVEIDERQAQIEVAELPTLPGDAVQLMQLFQNLVANAIKYCRRRAPEIHINAERWNDDWHITVEDNGIGIEPERIGEMFRIFQRLHEDESEFTGTGIGLAVCKRIVERHDGQIWVESTPGDGSVFHFTLAAEPRNAEDPPAP